MATTEIHPVSQAIKAAREGAGLSQWDLARLLDTGQTTIARWETTRVPSVDDIAAIEEALELPGGFILRQAGYVDEPAPTVEEAVAHDGTLTRTAKDLVLGAYRSVRRA